MISIIVPCYNLRDVVEITIKSVLSQRCQEFELILVNDGSADDTLSILQKYKEQSDRIILIDKPNGGVSSARNAGLAVASYPYIFFLDGDDYIEPTFIEEFSKLLHKTEITIIGCKQWKSQKRCKIKTPYVTNNYLRDYLKGSLYIAMSSFIVSKSLLIDNQIKFDENTFYSEDREFIVKCFIKSKSFSVISKSLFHYTWREASAMNSHIYSHKQYTSIQAMERVYTSLKMDDSVKDVALMQLQLTILLDIRLYLRCESKSTELWGLLCSHLHYLRNSTPLYFNRFGVFVCVMHYLFMINKKVLFKTLQSF